jgi:4'-phosphopantetheinyl transferase
VTATWEERRSPFVQGLPGIAIDMPDRRRHNQAGMRTTLTPPEVVPRRRCAPPQRKGESDPGSRNVDDTTATRAEVGNVVEKAVCDIRIAHLTMLGPHHVQWLDNVELARRAEFVRDADRDRFTLGAVLLRVAIAAHAAAVPASIVIDRTCDQCRRPHGRPRPTVHGLEASVSHSGDLVAVALSEAGPVGVDVERVVDLDHTEFLARVCRPSETLEVRSQRDFYVLWTRKEAVLKASGLGLRVPMNSVELSSPTEMPRLRSFDGVELLPEACQISDLDAFAGYCGAAAVLTEVPIEFQLSDATALLD